MNLAPEELAVLAEFGGNVPGMHELDMILALVREVLRLRVEEVGLVDGGSTTLMSDSYDETMRAAEAETSEWAAMDQLAAWIQSSLRPDDPRRYLAPDEPGATGPAAARSYRQMRALLTADEFERKAFSEMGMGRTERATMLASFAAFWAGRAVTL